MFEFKEYVSQEPKVGFATVLGIQNKSLTQQSYKAFNPLNNTRPCRYTKGIYDLVQVIQKIY